MAKDNRVTDPTHESTWGATPQAKQDWADKNADKVRKEVAEQNEKAATEGPASA